MTQVVLNSFHIAQFNHHRVGNDRNASDVRHFGQVLSSAFFEVNLIRYFKPLHVHGTTIHPFHVDQVDCGNVLRYRVAAVGSAAQSQRRDVRVVNVADSAMRGRRIDENTSGLQTVGELHDNFFVVRVDSRAVAHASEFNDLSSALDTLISVLNFVASQNRAQFLSGQRVLRTYAFQFGNQNLGSCRYLDSAHFGDLRSGLTYDCRVNCAFLNVHSAVGQLGSFFFINEVAAIRDHLLLHLVEDGFFNNNSLLGCADHAVVESFGKDDVGNRLVDVRALLDEGRNVTRAYAESRFAAAVCRFNHCSTACCQDQSHVRIVHQGVGFVHRRLFDPLDAVLRSAGFYRCIMQDFCRRGTTSLRRRVETEYNRITCLNGNQRFEHRGGCWVGYRCDTHYNADRFGDLLEAVVRVVFNNPYCLVVFDSVPDIFSGENILRDFVFVNAAACFFNSQFCQVHVLVETGKRHSVHNVVHLLLIKSHESFLSLLCFIHQSLNVLFSGWLLYLGGDFILNCHFPRPPVNLWCFLSTH
ncbi:hypothetical protein D3C81_369800 [compost metagenome]